MSGRNAQTDDTEYTPVRVDDGWSDRSVTDEMDLDVDTLVEVRLRLCAPSPGPVALDWCFLNRWWFVSSSCAFHRQRPTTSG